MTTTFEMLNETKGKLPSLPFEQIKIAVLGEHYDLSLVITSAQKTHTLNKKYRGKNKAANVLSFPLSPTSGEIFLSPEVAKKEASLFEKTYPKFLGVLFIHGLLHLKGLSHGSTMSRLEKKFEKKFNL